MSHPDLRPESLEALRDAFASQGADPGTAVDRTGSPAEPPLTRSGTAAWRTRLRHRVRRAASPVLDPVLDRAARVVEHRIGDHLAAEQAALSSEVLALRTQVAALVPIVAGLEEIRQRTVEALSALGALETNQELFKGELRSFGSELHHYGNAIAPGAGLQAAPARFAELREQVNAIDRRLRRREHEVAAGPPSAVAAEEVGSAEAEPRPGTAGGSGSGFDYVGFEQRFRGDPAEILRILEGRYLPLLHDHQPVLDFGCGRGELLGSLVEHGIEAVGVDSDTGMAEYAAGRGLPAHAGDGLEWMRQAEEGSLGSIIAVHVVEHLRLPQLTEFLELAATRLRPGGILVAETPNPMSLIVLGNSYILDPTHVWPLHPSLMTFLCERAGFRDVELRFHSPAEAYRLPPIGGDDAPGWVAEINDRLERLNDVLFGHQEYAVVATTPPG